MSATAITISRDITTSVLVFRATPSHTPSAPPFKNPIPNKFSGFILLSYELFINDSWLKQCFH